MIDYVILKQELQTDPLKLGYAALAGADNAIADLLNDDSGKGAGTTAVQEATKDGFLLSLIPFIEKIPDARLSFWQIQLLLLTALGSLPLAHPSLQYLIGQAIKDGMLTVQQVQQMQSVRGSRAEVLFGVAAVVTSDDIAKARGA